MGEFFVFHSIAKSMFWWSCELYHSQPPGDAPHAALCAWTHSQILSDIQAHLFYITGCNVAVLLPVLPLGTLNCVFTCVTGTALKGSSCPSMAWTGQSWSVPGSCVSSNNLKRFCSCWTWRTRSSMLISSSWAFSSSSCGWLLTLSSATKSSLSDRCFQITRSFLVPFQTKSPFRNFFCFTEHTSWCVLLLTAAATDDSVLWMCLTSDISRTQRLSCVSAVIWLCVMPHCHVEGPSLTSLIYSVYIPLI